MQQHIKSVSHIRAMGAKRAHHELEANELPRFEKSLEKADKQTLSNMDKLYRSAYYLVKKERPFSDFEPILELQELNGLKIGDRYRNDKGAKDFVCHIAEHYVDKLKSLLQNGNYFSVFCDGSTDRTESEKEVIMIRVLENFYPKMIYLKLEEPPSTKANGILSAINNAFQSLDFPEYKQKLVGFGTDGANVMLGHRAGVVKLLKDEGNTPWVLTVWCLAHRLELAIKDAFKKTYMENVIEVLTLIYYFYKGSSKRNKEIKTIADVMDDHFLKPGKANGTRWVDHKLRAVSKLLKNWKLIVIHMKNYAEDVTNRGDDRAKAKGILKKLSEFKLVYYLHFIKDILSEVATVSLLFQREDINVSSAVTKLQSSHVSLNDMLTNQGLNVTQFNTEIVGKQYKQHTLHNVIAQETLTRQTGDILKAVIKCMQSRFQNMHEDPIYLACHAFDHKNWPDTDEALLHYGRDDILVVAEHFQTLLDNADCDVPAAQREWRELKIHIRRNNHFQAIHPLEVWRRISLEDVDLNNFSNILKIIHLTSLYPLSNASCERSFSAMKRIKSDWRCSLSNDTLDKLMRIEIQGPNIRDFKPRPIVKRWWISGVRSKRPRDN